MFAADDGQGSGTGRAAVIDVDGTLVDTNHLHVATWWEAFRQAGHQVPTHAIHRAIGLGSADLVTHVLGGERAEDETRCVALLCGGIPRADLERAAADAVFDNPAHLLAALPMRPPA
ncbi:HAD family hydrolase [Streptomyces sp. NPDC048231]|uniref:HAD family hydrolase n=1 Tax=Streptomyces sp. NPDC048231 TaxID=3365519 RepID=UPI0037210DA9